jgi:peptidyl-prolyl cis-trans isomerase C
MKSILKNTVKNTILTISVITLWGCAAQQPENWITKVDGSYITQEDVDKQIQKFPENTRKQLQENNEPVITQLINQKLLYTEAQKKGLEENPEFLKQLALLQEQFDNAKHQLLSSLLIKEKINDLITIEPQEVEAFYTKNKNKFAAYEQRNARHILVKSGRKALTIYNKAIAKKDFETLAKKYSIDPTGKTGGDLGWFRKGQLVPEFEKAVFKLARKGSISKVVKTQFGYHVIKLEGIKQIPKQNFKDVAPRIKQLLFNQKQNTALTSYINTLKESHSIQHASKKETPLPTKDLSQTKTK